MRRQLCYVCGIASHEKELRPYGAGGQPICFSCMTGDPVRVLEAGRQFEKLFTSEHVVVVRAQPPQEVPDS